MPNIAVLRSRAERARKTLGLSPEDLTILQQEAHGLYEEVSYDLEPDIRSRRTCRRGTIIEVVTDANRLERAVRRRLRLNDVDLDQDSSSPLVKACRNGAIADLIGPAFPYNEYEAGRFEDEL